MPTWCLLGASLVPPRCLLGASLHPLTWSQSLFWTPKTAEDCHSEPTCSQLGCIWDQLGPPPGQLKSTWGYFRPTYVPLGVDMGHLKPDCGKGDIKNHCFSLCFCMFLTCGPSYNLGVKLRQLESNLNLHSHEMKAIWTRFEPTWGQLQ